VTQSFVLAIAVALSLGTLALDVAGMNSAPPVAVEGVR
jgi:hypothetical protein